MSLFEKSSAPTGWEYIFDCILLALFVVPVCLAIGSGILCSQTAGLGSRIVCTIPAFEPLAKFIEAMLVINFMLLGIFLTFPLLLISYIGSTARKMRRLARYGFDQAFAQNRFGLIVWMLVPGIIPASLLGYTLLRVLVPIWNRLFAN